MRKKELILIDAFSPGVTRVWTRGNEMLFSVWEDDEVHMVYFDVDRRNSNFKAHTPSFTPRFQCKKEK